MWPCIIDKNSYMRHKSYLDRFWILLGKNILKNQACCLEKKTGKWENYILWEYIIEEMLEFEWLLL